MMNKHTIHSFKKQPSKFYLADVLNSKIFIFIDHINQLEVILKILKKPGMQVNAKKSNWCAITNVSYYMQE